VTEAKGRWHRAAEIALPANAAGRYAGLYGVACGRAGSCVAVGGYEDTADAYLPMAVNSSKGRWGPAVRTPLPANAVHGVDQEAAFYKVACPVGGDCIAVGQYESPAGDQAMAAARSSR
jgi:hypothetical protein